MATSEDKKAFLAAVKSYNRSPSKRKAIEIFDRFLNPHKATAQFIYLPHSILQPVANSVQMYRGWLFERDHRFSGGGLANRIARMRSANQFKAQPAIFAPAVQLVERIGFMPAKRHAMLDRKVDPTVAQQAKARLRANDLMTLLDASISQRYSDDKARAVDRLDEFLKSLDIQLGAATVALAEQLVEHLQDSRLTINFSANNLFSRPWNMLGRSYKNIWQLPVGVKTDKYLDDRDKVEEELRGFSAPPKHYRRARRNAISLGTVSDGSDGLIEAPEEVLEEITRYGKRYAPGSTQDAPVLSKTFQPGSRAQYAAVDFLNAKFGGAVFYGRSFFVVDKRLKMNATITHTDTFDNSGKPKDGWQSVLANYHNLYPIIAEMDKDLLAKLIVAAQGGAEEALHAGGGYNYVECQFQGDANFGREIKEMYVSEAELNLVFDMDDPVTEMLADAVHEMRAKSWGSDRLRKNIEAFAKAHGITLKFIDDRAYPLDLSGKESHLPGFEARL